MLWGEEAAAAGSTLPWWGTALLAVGASLATLATAFASGLRQVIEAGFERFTRWVRGESGGVDGIEMLTRHAEFNAILNAARKIDSIDRVIVFIGHNGGGLPLPGKPYTVRSQTGWNTRGDGSEFSTYAFDLEVDQPYCEMLKTANLVGRINLLTREMPEGLLRNIYASEGVVHSILYKLKVDAKRNRFAYMTVASRKGDIPAGDQAMCDILVYRLRASLSQGGDR